MRPVFHQLERRAKAHVLVAFLGYALWVTLKHLLHRRGTFWVVYERRICNLASQRCRYMGEHCT